MIPAADCTAISQVVIVGAGQAGGCAAEALRKLGYAGKLTLAGTERHAPYERPPLSKEFLCSPAPKVPLTIMPSAIC